MPRNGRFCELCSFLFHRVASNKTSIQIIAFAGDLRMHFVREYIDSELLHTSNGNGKWTDGIDSGAGMFSRFTHVFVRVSLQVQLTQYPTHSTVNV